MNRAWKLELIEATNPDWHDLADDLGLEFVGMSFAGFPLSRE